MEPVQLEALFGRRVKQVRTQRGLSTRAVAERMQERGFDWNHNTVLKTEAAKRPVRLAEATTLASILQVGIFSLMQPEMDESKARLREQVTVLTSRQMRAIDEAQNLEKAIDAAAADAERANEVRLRLEAAHRAAIEQVRELGDQIRELDERLIDPEPLDGDS